MKKLFFILLIAIVTLLAFPWRGQKGNDFYVPDTLHVGEKISADSATLEIDSIDVNNMDIGSADIGSGEIDGTPIGANSASTGAFTTITASSTVTLTPETAVDALSINQDQNARGILIDHDDTGTTASLEIDRDGNSAGNIVGLKVNCTNAGAGKGYAAIFETGNVGIGTTGPGAELQINDGTWEVGSTPELRFGDSYHRITVNFGSQAEFYMYHGFDFRRHPSGSADPYFKVGDSEADADLAIKRDGNVGIGTTNPSHQLTLKGTTGFLDTDEATPAGTDSSIQVYANAGVPTIKGNATDGDNSTITWNTSDQILITGASGGLVLASGTPFLNGAVQWDVSDTDSINGAVIAYNSIPANMLTSASLKSIAGLTEADVSIIEATADNTYSVVTSGGNNYILGSNSNNSALEFKTPANVLSQIGGQASDGDLDDLADGSLTGTKVSNVVQSKEAWVTSASQNPSLLTLPTNATVLAVECWVSEAFTSDGADEVTVGYDASASAYATAIDVSGTGVKTVTLGTVAKTVDATSRDVEIYYVNGGSEPGAGKAHIVLTWIQSTVSP